MTQRGAASGIWLREEVEDLAGTVADRVEAVEGNRRPGTIPEWTLQPGAVGSLDTDNTVFRYKTVFGPAMRSRSLVGQRIEASLACKILNTMTGLGMPASVRVR